MAVRRETARIGVALSLSEAFRELRVVRGWVAIVALALGAYCLMAAVTAP